MQRENKREQETSKKRKFEQHKLIPETSRKQSLKRKRFSKLTLKSYEMGGELIAKASIDHIRQEKRKKFWFWLNKEKPKKDLRGSRPFRQAFSSNFVWSGNKCLRMGLKLQPTGAYRMVQNYSIGISDGQNRGKTLEREREGDVYIYVYILFSNKCCIYMCMHANIFFVVWNGIFITGFWVWC